MSTPNIPSVEPENPQAPERQSRHGAKARSGGKRIVTILSVVVLFVLAYGVTLFAYWELSGSSRSWARQTRATDPKRLSW